MGPNVRALFFYAKVFVIAGTLLGLFLHVVTRESMPWWPDTVMVGTFMGTVAVLIAAGRRRDRIANQHLRNAARLTRVWWSRNDV